MAMVVEDAATEAGTQRNGPAGGSGPSVSTDSAGDTAQTDDVLRLENVAKLVRDLQHIQWSSVVDSARPHALPLAALASCREQAAALQRAIESVGRRPDALLGRSRCGSQQNGACLPTPNGHETSSTSQDPELRQGGGEHGADHNRSSGVHAYKDDTMPMATAVAADMHACWEKELRAARDELAVEREVRGLETKQQRDELASLRRELRAARAGSAAAVASAEKRLMEAKKQHTCMLQTAVQEFSVARRRACCEQVVLGNTIREAESLLLDASRCATAAHARPEAVNGPLLSSTTAEAAACADVAAEKADAAQKAPIEADTSAAEAEACTVLVEDSSGRETVAAAHEAVSEPVSQRVSQTVSQAVPQAGPERGAGARSARSVAQGTQTDGEGAAEPSPPAHASLCDVGCQAALDAPSELRAALARRETELDLASVAMSKREARLVESQQVVVRELDVAQELLRTTEYGPAMLRLARERKEAEDRVAPLRMEVVELKVEIAELRRRLESASDRRLPAEGRQYSTYTV